MTSFHCIRNYTHTAHQNVKEARVHYRYHPRYGELLHIESKRTQCGESCYVTKKSNSKPCLVPAWMCEQEAEHHQLVSIPRIDIRALLNLRFTLCSTILSSQGNEENPPERTNENAPTTAEMGRNNSSSQPAAKSSKRSSPSNRKTTRSLLAGKKKGSSN